jgi:hypothetical protein
MAHCVLHSNSISIVVTVDVHVKEAGGVVVSVNVTATIYQ